LRAKRWKREWHGCGKGWRCWRDWRARKKRKGLGESSRAEAWI